MSGVSPCPIENQCNKPEVEVRKGANPPSRSDEHGRVGVIEWFAFIGDIKKKRGDAALASFLQFLESKVLEAFPDVVLREPEPDPDASDEEDGAGEDEDPAVVAERQIKWAPRTPPCRPCPPPRGDPAPC